jgi:hypothetical protein
MSSRGLIMPELAKAPSTENVFFKNEHPSEDNSRVEILSGLFEKQKKINPKYFYDYLNVLLNCLSIILHVQSGRS